MPVAEVIINVSLVILNEARNLQQSNSGRAQNSSCLVLDSCEWVKIAQHTFSTAAMQGYGADVGEGARMMRCGKIHFVLRGKGLGAICSKR